MTPKRFPRLSGVASLLSFSLLFCFTAAPAAAQERVVAILDAENLTVQTNGNIPFRIRIGGIDAPEPNQPFGTEARAELASMVKDREVSIEKGKIDSQGHFVSRVLIDGKDLALEMIKAGVAWHNRDRSEVSGANFDAYSSAELKARTAKIGLWANENPVEPWEWRKRPRSSQPASNAARPVSSTNQVYVGDVGKRLYYALECDEAKFNPSVAQRGFYSEKEAIDAGFTRGATCTPRKPEVTDASVANATARGGTSGTTLRTAKAIKIIQVTSNIEAYKGKLVTVEGEINMSTRFTGPFSGKDAVVFAFRIADGTDSLMGYTLKTSGASRLRGLLLQRDDPSAWGKFRIIVAKGADPNDAYGELIDFVLYN
jgi:micrococcal nuclease